MSFVQFCMYIVHTLARILRSHSTQWIVSSMIFFFRYSLFYPQTHISHTHEQFYIPYSDSIFATSFTILAIPMGKIWKVWNDYARQKSKLATLQKIATRLIAFSLSVKCMKSRVSNLPATKRTFQTAKYIFEMEFSFLFFFFTYSVVACAKISTCKAQATLLRSNNSTNLSY